MPTKRIVLISIGLLLCAALLHAQEGEEKILALGKYDFYHYYEYDELTRFMKDMHDAFPNLTELTSLAKTDMGREVWMLTINNPQTGQPEEKPGFFINQIHASEVIAAASNCYTIWYLLDNFGKDEEVTQLVNDNVWYIVPRLEPRHTSHRSRLGRILIPLITTGTSNSTRTRLRMWMVMDTSFRCGRRIPRANGRFQSWTRA